MGLDENGLNVIQAARIRRTRYFREHKSDFTRTLGYEIAKHVRRSERAGMKPAVRLNGTSDIPWENVRVGNSHVNFMEKFPNVVFYDYTKYPIGLRKKVAAIPNYSLSFSLAEDNDSYAEEALAAGVNVVAVFNTKKKDGLPDRFMGYPVIDGDLHDLRFLDPSPAIVGLRAKGRAKQDDSGFVRHV